MAGYADLEIRPPAGAPPFDNGFKRYGFFTEMNPRGIRGESHIEPIVDQDACGCAASFVNRETRGFKQSMRIEIFFANLNPTDSRRNGPGNGMVKQIYFRLLEAAWLCAGGSRQDFERAPVRYITKYGFTIGSQRSLSVPAASLMQGRCQESPIQLPRHASKGEEV